MSSDNNPTIEAHAAEIARLERDIEDWKQRAVDAERDRNAAIKALGEEARLRGLAELERDRLSGCQKGALR